MVTGAVTAAAEGRRWLTRERCCTAAAKLSVECSLVRGPTGLLQQNNEGKRIAWLVIGEGVRLLFENRKIKLVSLPKVVNVCGG
jgi:hypothetical protein